MLKVLAVSFPQASYLRSGTCTPCLTPPSPPTVPLPGSCFLPGAGPGPLSDLGLKLEGVQHEWLLPAGFTPPFSPLVSLRRHPRSREGSEEGQPWSQVTGAITLCLTVPLTHKRAVKSSFSCPSLGLCICPGGSERVSPSVWWEGQDLFPKVCRSFRARMTFTVVSSPLHSIFLVTLDLRMRWEVGVIPPAPPPPPPGCPEAEADQPFFLTGFRPSLSGNRWEEGIRAGGAGLGKCWENGEVGQIRTPPLGRAWRIKIHHLTPWTPLQTSSLSLG